MITQIFLDRYPNFLAMGPGALLIPTLLREKYHCDNPEAMFIPCCNYPFDET